MGLLYNTVMDLTEIDNLKIAMRLAGLKASKNLGQHFLVDRASLDVIMSAGELSKKDIILEIGPGLGVMTLPLAKEVRQVVAVEADSALATLLERNKPENLVIENNDIMRFNLKNLPDGYKVVSNIPYYLTSPILRMLLEAENKPSLLSLLIQKEVAQRIVAQPGKMSVLAFSVQYYGHPELVETVERHKFWPPPKVDSAVLKVRVLEKPLFEADSAKLFRLVKAGFGEKRKMLKNSLSGGLNISLELADQIIKKAKLPANARAQELNMDQWKNLYRQAVAAEVV